MPSRVITLSQAPALAPWILSRRSPGLVFSLAKHHCAGDARRLVGQCHGDDQRRPPLPQPDHPCRILMPAPSIYAPAAGKTVQN
jgi:hypothetical protein